MDKLKEKEEQSIDNQALQDKTDECEKLARDNATLKNQMQSIVIKLTKDIKDRKNNEENLTWLLKEGSDECCMLNYEND